MLGEVGEPELGRTVCDELMAFASVVVDDDAKVIMHSHDIVAELLGKRLGPDGILSGQPTRLAISDVTCSHSRPK